MTATLRLGQISLLRLYGSLYENYTASGIDLKRHPVARNTTSKKDLRELRKAAGDSSTDKKIVLLLVGLPALVILAIGAFAVLITANDSSNSTPNKRGLLPVGSQAPDFAATTVDGGSVSLGDAGGKEATMLVFFASWCPHCNKEAPTISELEREHDDLRVVMMGIDGRDHAGKVQEFVDRYGIEGPTAYAPSVGRTYRVSGYPTIYVLDKNNYIIAAHSGEAPKGALEGWIEEARETGG
jgi:thiol-disulfide isomerase/thioredoxin